VHLSPANYLKLRNQIEKVWGRRIRSQPDCIALSRAIQQKTGHKIGHHTLRRFFGLVEWKGKFRSSTLNQLAEYIDQPSIESLVQSFKDEEDLVEILVRLQRQNIDIDEYYIGQWMTKTVSIESTMMAGHMLLVRLQQRDEERIIRLLNTLKPLDDSRSLHYAICSVLAHYTAEKFHDINDKAFVIRLMQETPYINLILSFYVPMTELDAGFGQHIKWMLELSKEQEHQDFGCSLLSTSALLKGDEAQAKAFFNKIQNNQPYFCILQGRIDLLRYLFKPGNKGIVTSLIPPRNEEIFYFKAILPMLVLLDKKKELDEILGAYDFDKFIANHWLEEAVKRQYKLTQTWSRVMDGDKQDAWMAIDEFENTLWPKDYEGISRLIADKIKAQLS
jgi:hypothetical protein